MRVILIRHGETDWNKEQVFRGRLDIQLNQTGREQARAVAEALKGLNIVAVYSSPLSRALETAKIIGSYLKLKPRLNEGFLDFNYGGWQGMPHRHVEKQYPYLYLPIYKLRTFCRLFF
jgi:broad specificity phosphatase PhoE